MHSGCIHILLEVSQKASHDIKTIPLMGMTHAFAMCSHSRGKRGLAHIQTRYSAVAVASAVCMNHSNSAINYTIFIIVQKQRRSCNMPYWLENWDSLRTILRCISRGLPQKILYSLLRKNSHKFSLWKSKKFCTEFYMVGIYLQSSLLRSAELLLLWKSWVRKSFQNTHLSTVQSKELFV